MGPTMRDRIHNADSHASHLARQEDENSPVRGRDKTTLPLPENMVAGGGEARKIAIMLPRLSRYGGVEQFGYRLAEGLAKRGHAVDFICARQETKAPPGVEVVSVGRPWGMKFIKLAIFLWKAERLRKTGKYDFAISLGKSWNQDVTRMGGGPLRVFWSKSELALPPGMPRLMKRLRRRLSPANWLTLFVEKHQFTAESEVIAVSHLVRDWLLAAHTELDPKKVHVVYNRPDTERFSPPLPEERTQMREALFASCSHGKMPGPEAVFIGTASTNFELKGVGPLIRAMARLPENTMLFVAGGRDSGTYQRLARKLGIGHRVFFCGKVTDMPAFYKALDIFILPTFYDACSNAVLEALASGCKTITSSSNGASFFLHPDSVLSEPGDVEAMVECLTDCIKRPVPESFVWPQNVESGLDCFMDKIEAMLRK